MDMKQLTTFETLAKEGNYVKASFKLNYAASTLTDHIHSLEREMGVKLVKRGKKQLELTEAGKEFLPYARQMLKLYEEASSKIQGLDARGILRIAVAESIGQYSMVDLFHDFAVKYPEENLSIRVGNCADFPELLRAGDIDMGFSYGIGSLESGALASVPLFEEPLFYVVHPSHRLAGKKQVYPGDLTGENFAMTYENCCYAMALKQMLAREHVELKAQLHLGSVTMIRRYVKEKFGVALLPLAAIEEDLQRGELTLLPWQGEKFSILAQIIFQKEQPVTATMEALIREAKEPSERRKKAINQFLLKAELPARELSTKEQPTEELSAAGLAE